MPVRGRCLGQTADEFGAQIGDAPGAHKPHGGEDLLLDELDCPLDSALASGHTDCVPDRVPSLPPDA